MEIVGLSDISFGHKKCISPTEKPQISHGKKNIEVSFVKTRLMNCWYSAVLSLVGYLPEEMLNFWNINIYGEGVLKSSWSNPLRNTDFEKWFRLRTFQHPILYRSNQLLLWYKTGFTIFKFFYLYHWLIIREKFLHYLFILSNFTQSRMKKNFIFHITL